MSEVERLLRGALVPGRAARSISASGSNAG